MPTKKICFIGNAGSGKSTLSAEVFVNLKKRHKNAELVTEFVRTDIQMNGPMTNIWEQYRTRSNQENLENIIPASVEYMITDSGVLTPYFYASLYADNTNERQRLVLADMYRYLINDLFLKRYDHVFFIPMAETYAKNTTMLTDGTRYQSPEQIQILEEHMTLVFTKIHKVDNVHVLTGEMNDRCQKVLDIILN